MKRLPSYPPIEGQLDVFEVLEMIEDEDTVEDGAGKQLEDFADEVADGLTVERGEGYSYWVVDEHGTRLHGKPFWSQVECWAFIIGWRAPNY